MRNRLKPRSKLALNRPPHVGRPAAFGVPCGFLISLAQNSGTTDNATKYEANNERTTASASAVNKKRLTP